MTDHISLTGTLYQDSHNPLTCIMEHADNTCSTVRFETEASMLPALREHGATVILTVRAEKVDGVYVASTTLPNHVPVKSEPFVYKRGE